MGRFCSHCLAPGHLAHSCSSQIRCRACFNYGHLRKWCLTKSWPRVVWPPKRPPSPIVTHDADHTKPSFPPQPQANSCQSHPALPPPPPPDHMANFPGNPMLYVPMGQHRGLLLDASLIPFGHGNSIVQKHDEARNFRACSYIRQWWIMFLAFPLDYQTLDFIEAAVASFGRLLHWFEGPTKSRILTQCLVLTPDRVPCSVVVSQGTTLGNGRSWSVPVLILGGHFPDAFLADEDPVPAGGNSHPGHGGVATTEEELAPQNQNEMQNNKNGEGWPLNQNAMQNNDNDGDWLAWPPIEEVDNNVVEE
uniref:CCHC-type domain-containing protein n=1 Tax=Setaria viridis TaxID=4556 RepID=A0A4U6UG19_SETVI|nr:hypothetical protein SEVIR_5G156900v2 [Setaria viridis]